MSTLSVGDLQGLAVNSNVVTVPTGHKLEVTDAGGLTAPGHILQVVRATDSTERSTTSTSFTDVTGMSVTITPSSATSEIIVIATGYVTTVADTYPYINIQLTDSSNSTMTGAEVAKWGAGTVGSENGIVIIGHDSPATTSAVTYKVRFKSEGGQTVRFRNNLQDGQMFAFEVSA